MSIKHDLILTLKEWKGFGPKNINIVAEYLSLQKQDPVGPEEYYDILSSLLHSGKLSRIKTMLPAYELRKAHSRAVQLIEETERNNISIVSRYDEEFPKRLNSTVKEDGTPDVPLLLFYRGDLSITSKNSVAVIGTREPSQDGINAGLTISAEFAKSGFNIVSGLALGCDTAGHVGALNAGGVTTAFLAHGLDTVYPLENRKLAEEIVEKGGLLMSEYPVGAGVDRYKLVARDRLQAGLADATVVIQTGIRGGTMHAVNATIQAGKPLYAVDFSRIVPFEKVSGNKLLIEQGHALPLRANTLGNAIATCSKKADGGAQNTPKSSLSETSRIYEPTLFE